MPSPPCELTNRPLIVVSQVHGAAGLPLIDDDIVERQGADGIPAVLLEARGEQRAPIFGVAPGEHRIDVLQHGVGADVGEESEAAAVDPEQWDRISGHQPRGIEQGAVGRRWRR